MDPATIKPALRRFEHLARLDDQQLESLAQATRILDAARGSRLLELGGGDNHQLFLLEGELQLIAGDGEVRIMRDDDHAARSPVSRLRPSRYTVTAHTDVRYLLVDQDVLNECGGSAAHGLLVEESVVVSEPGEVFEQDISHPLIGDVFNDLSDGRLVVPSEPEVAVRVGRALRAVSDNPNLFAEILAICPVLSVKAMRIARRSGRVRSPREAVQRLGIDRTYALTVNCVLRETLRSDSDLVRQRLRNWWERSLRVAAICRELAAMREQFDSEYAATIGLLHAIAEPVMLDYAERHADLRDPEALEALIRANRAELGRVLLSMWDFPREIVDAAAFSNRWDYDHGGDADYTDIVLVAQWHATIGGGARRHIPPVEQIPAFARLGLSPPSPQLSLKVIEAATSAVDHSEALLDI